MNSDAYVRAISVKGPRTRAASSWSRFPRLFKRKERWGLSWLGWLVLLAVLLSLSYLGVLRVYPFLAVTNRADANVLVIEGWVHPFAIQVAVDEFRTGRYERIFTTGGPVVGSGRYTSDSNTLASVGASGVQAAGVPADRIQMVPSHVNDWDRTYGSAVALRRWLRDHDAQVRGVNVVTENTHARRSWLLFSKALGPEISVGIIAVPNPDYDVRRWWRYSEGVKEVGSEALAYVYARLFFHASEPPPVQKAAVSDSGTR